MRRGLAKGLSQLMADQFDASPTEAPISAVRPNSRQPRLHFDDSSIAELAASIKRHGVIQPLIVRMDDEGRFELIAGERRLRAAVLAGLQTVPIVVRTAEDLDSLELALIENVQREDISAIECARAYKQLIDEFGLTQEAIAERVGKSRVAVTNTLRLLRLPKRIQQAIQVGKLSEGHGRALLGLENEALQLAMFERIVQQDLTVREVETAARNASKRPKSSSKRIAIDPNWRELQDAAAQFLGAPVAIKRTSGTGGRIEIEFFSDDDLGRIVETLGLET